MAKECRKYRISLVLASQEARDFNISLFSAIANFVVLRLTEPDAKALVRNVASSDQECVSLTKSSRWTASRHFTRTKVRRSLRWYCCVRESVLLFCCDFSHVLGPNRHWPSAFHREPLGCLQPQRRVSS